MKNVVDIIVGGVTRDSFDDIVYILKPLLTSYIRNYLKNTTTLHLEDEDSLYNLCLYKLWEVVNRYDYIKEFDFARNEKRFYALLNTSIYNMLKDMVGAAKATKRLPVSGTVISLDSPDAIGAKNIPYEHTEIFSDDIKNKIEDGLCSYPSRSRVIPKFTIKVWRLMSEGYKLSEIARKLGVHQGKVTYAYTRRIKPVVKRVMRRSVSPS